MSASRRLLAGCCLLALGACGQKGALFLPEPPRAVVPAATPADPESDTQKDQESKAVKPNAGAL